MGTSTTLALWMRPEGSRTGFGCVHSRVTATNLDLQGWPQDGGEDHRLLV